MRARAIATITVALVGAATVAGTAVATPAPGGSDPSTTWTLRPGPGQLAVLGAAPGTQVELLDADGDVAAAGEVDLVGSLLFRGLEPGPFTVRTPAAESAETVVPGFDEPPAQDFYTAQEIGEGFGYVTVRDGTTLSVNVVFPGDPADGPFPTVVEYSGYDPSNPTGSGVGIAPLAVALGYTWVGVNMRGSGCSGGSFDYFEPI